jgi:glucose-6-phosphate 1-dehydrogenase
MMQDHLEQLIKLTRDENPMKSNIKISAELVRFLHPANLYQLTECAGS